MKLVHSTPILHSETKDGSKKFWRGHVEQDERGYGHTYSETWKILKDGSESDRQFSAPKMVLGKNIGKSNEKLSLDQAIFNIDSDMRKKRLVGYVEEGETSQVLPLPMLAQKFEDVPVTYPVYVQPKFDGVRALFDGEKFWSRKGKVFPYETTKHLMFDTEGHIVDGEIILHDNALEEGQEPVQATLSAVMKYDDEKSPWLTFRMFDVVMEGSFGMRYQHLLAMNKRTVAVRDRVFKVETHVARSVNDVNEFHDLFVDDGNEGAMVRTEFPAKYEHGHKSRSLLKVKKFEDHEYKVVNVLQGEGRELGCAIFVCVTENLKHTFNVVPIGAIGTLEDRKQMWNDRAKYIGQMLTVKHQGYTDAGIPRFPKGKCFRPEWDR